MSSGVQVIVLSIYIGLLIFWGSHRRPSFASWHMFANLDRVQFDLYYRDDLGNLVRFNPWDYLPHTYFTMSQVEAQVFISYIEAFHELTLSGTLVVWHGDTHRSVRIHDGQLAD